MCVTSVNLAAPLSFTTGAAAMCIKKCISYCNFFSQCTPLEGRIQFENRRRRNRRRCSRPDIHINTIANSFQCVFLLLTIHINVLVYAAAKHLNIRGRVTSQIARYFDVSIHTHIHTDSNGMNKPRAMFLVLTEKSENAKQNVVRRTMCGAIAIPCPMPPPMPPLCSLCWFGVCYGQHVRNTG